MKRHFHSSRVCLLLAFLALFDVPGFAVSNDAVILQDQGDRVTLANGIVSVTLLKTTAAIPAMTLGQSPNLAGRGGYFAIVNSGGHDGWDVHNAVYKVVRNTPGLVELSLDALVGNVHFDQHYILRRGDQGYYVFVIMRHHESEPRESNGQIRWSFYLNSNLFNYQLASDAEQGIIPDMRGSQKVQDAT